MTREQIVQLVREAVSDLCGMGQWRPHPEVCEAVAARVADKLAHLTLSQEDRARLRGLALDSRVAGMRAHDDGSGLLAHAHQARADLLDRLLGGAS